MLALAKGEIQLIFGPNVFLILLCFAFKWLHLVEGGWLGSIWQFHGQSQDIVDSTCGTYVGEKLFAFFFFLYFRREANQASAVCQECGKLYRDRASQNLSLI